MQINVALYLHQRNFFLKQVEFPKENYNWSKYRQVSDLSIFTSIIFIYHENSTLKSQGTLRKRGEKILRVRESGWLIREGTQMKSQQYGFLHKTCIMTSVDMLLYTVEISQGPIFRKATGHPHGWEPQQFILIPISQS